jgi:hypothetical protein
VKLADTHSKEEIARMAENILKNELFMEVIAELTEGYIHVAFQTKTPSEDRTKLVYQRAGMDMMIARLNGHINEYKMSQTNKNLHTN